MKISFTCHYWDYFSHSGEKIFSSIITKNLFLSYMFKNSQNRYQKGQTTYTKMVRQRTWKEIKETYMCIPNQNKNDDKPHLAVKKHANWNNENSFTCISWAKLYILLTQNVWKEWNSSNFRVRIFRTTNL